MKPRFQIWIRMFLFMKVAEVEIGSDKYVARTLGSNTYRDSLNRQLKPSDDRTKDTDCSAKSLLVEFHLLENLNTVIERHKGT
jgi:hypothetical protein